ncbi:hypothetical protein E2C01_005489 [Portunus trituberculatus]|uniref:Uncharacterized protein n=1 Tax=Portunus trituberculatus TaxID=210409 RepID=A0A5B7CV98_PORTR|nr:hypothetical protein [Portunus trituberculatus]
MFRSHTATHWRQDQRNGGAEILLPHGIGGRGRRAWAGQGKEPTKTDAYSSRGPSFPAASPNLPAHAHAWSSLVIVEVVVVVVGSCSEVETFPPSREQDAGHAKGRFFVALRLGKCKGKADNEEPIRWNKDLKEEVAITKGG